ncbi:ABC transporter ATP-binding protein [Scytonema sp. HK-05]|nr:ABC transporter ATP-binding protein [Scytonema sp. HK-05]
MPKQTGAIYWNGKLVDDPANFFVPPRSAYTPQIPQLFSYSLQDNLLLGLDTRKIDLAKAIELAVFERDVADMPEGLLTLLGPKGVRLSGGQLQRAAAARMFVRQPELLIFDRKTRRKPLALDMGISRQGLLSPVKRLSGFSHSDII